MGSAGSAKSYSITQKLIIRACSEQIRILVCRKYGTTIRNTVFSLFKEILAKWKIIQLCKINESDYRITMPNQSEIIFMGLDDETKLLSLNNISTIWVEEAYEVEKNIIEQLNLRMRGQARNQQIILSWNPISKAHWLYDFTEINPPQSFILIKSTYRDNPFLSAQYIDALEELRERNPQKARVYCDGEWGIDSDGLVYTRWTIADINEEEIAKRCEHRVGMDFGFADPTAIVSSYLDAKTHTIYICDEYYKTGMTLDDMYQELIIMQLYKSQIWCDSAEPRTIDYLRRKHLDAKPCIKGAGSVSGRIAYLQNQSIIVSPKCVNVIRELENYSYKIDKRTGKYTDDTTHEYSHSLDALGYAYSALYTKSGLQTLNKSILGL